MRSGLNKFIPAAYIQNAIFIPEVVRESDQPYALYNYLCHFAGDIQFGQGLLDWKEEDVKQATYFISKYKTYRRYLEEDFYQLVPIPADKKGWDGWQFDDRKTDSGIVILFRMNECEKETFKVPLRAIKNIGVYHFENILGNGEFYADNGGLTVELKKHNAMLLYYSK